MFRVIHVIMVIVQKVNSQDITALIKCLYINAICNVSCYMDT